MQVAAFRLRLTLMNLPPGHAENARRAGWLLAAVTTAGLALRLTGLTGHGPGFHEISLVRVTAGGWDALSANLAAGRPPLYPLLMWVWSAVFGDSLLCLRLPSVLFSVAVIPLTFAVARRLFDARTGLLAAGLVALSPHQIGFAQSHRYYALMTLLGVGSALMLLRALGVGQAVGGRPGGTVRPPGGHRRDWIGYVTVSALLFYVQPMAIFTLAAVAATIGVMTVRGGLRARQQTRFWASQIAILALAMPWLLLPALEVVRSVPVTETGARRVPGLDSPPWYAPLRTAVNFFFGWVGYLRPGVVLTGSLVLAVGALVAVVRERPAPGARRGFGNLWGVRPWIGDLGEQVRTAWWESERSWGLVVGWAAGPLVLGLLVSKLMRPVYLDHYFISAAPAWFLAAAGGLVLARRTVPLRFSVAALAVWMIGAVWAAGHDANRNAWPDAVRWVTERGRPAGGLAFASERGRLAEAAETAENWHFLTAGPAGGPVAGLPPVDWNWSPVQRADALRARMDAEPKITLVVRRRTGPLDEWLPEFIADPGPGLKTEGHRVFGDLVVLELAAADAPVATEADGEKN